MGRSAGYGTYRNSFLFKRARQKSCSFPPELRNDFASFISSGRGGRESANFHAVRTSHERSDLRQVLSSRCANDSDTSCMKLLLNKDNACSAWVLTGRTGQEVIASG